MKPWTVALATYDKLPELAADDRLLARHLHASGIGADAVVWDNPRVAWGNYDAIVLRSSWDYHHKPARFRAWLDEREREEAFLWNPPVTARWNMNKHYLQELQNVGVRVAETAWIEQGSTVTVAAVLGDRAWNIAVIKPAISASADGTWLLTAEDPLRNDLLLRDLLERGDVLVQEFLPEIQAQGEWSLCFVGSSFSHAVLKKPQAGDFRVQVQHGGTYVSMPAPRPAVAAASRILELTRMEWLYARVDGIVRDGDFLLLEVEMLEPSLFLDSCEDAPSRFARAIIERLDGRSNRHPN